MNTSQNQILIQEDGTAIDRNGTYLPFLTKMIQTFGRDKVICERCGATALTFYTQCDNPKEKIGCEGEKKVAALFSMKDEVCKYYDYFTGQTVVIEKRYER